jgi:hypothetical protein
MDVHSFGNERDGDGGDADEAPLPFRVLHDFADDERREDSRRAHPMADFARRGAVRVFSILSGLYLAGHFAVNLGSDYRSVKRGNTGVSERYRFQ